LPPAEGYVYRKIDHTQRIKPDLFQLITYGRCGEVGRTLQKKVRKKRKKRRKLLFGYHYASGHQAGYAL
jgi:hypothetical protein